MRFAHDTEPAIRSAVDLVNWAQDDQGLDLGRPIAFHSRERYTGPLPRTTDEVHAIQLIIRPLRELLIADRDAAAQQVNQILARTRTEPRLVRHDDLDWHLHITPDDAPWPRQILAETAMAVIDLIRSDELSRLSICQGDECDGLVFDLTRNRSKIFCSPACSNKAAVAAYRERQRAKV